MKTLTIKTERNVQRGRIYHKIVSIEGNPILSRECPIDYVERAPVSVVAEPDDDDVIRSVFVYKLVNGEPMQFAHLTVGAEYEEDYFIRTWLEVRLSTVLLSEEIEKGRLNNDDVMKKPNEVLHVLW